MDTLRDFIAYARSQCKPKLSEEAATTLIDGYVDMRRQGVSRKVSRSLEFWAATKCTPPPVSLCSFVMQACPVCCSACYRATQHATQCATQRATQRPHVTSISA